MARFYFFDRFILLLSLVGLVCCACQPISTITATVAAGESDQSETKESAKVLSTAANTSTRQSDRTQSDSLEQTSQAAYQNALELATSAHALSQGAISGDDWDLVASRWRRAADQLELVTAESEHYHQAQQKIAEYTQNAAQTQAQIERLHTERHVAVSQPPTAPSKQPNPLDEYAVGKRRVRVPIVRRLHGTPVVEVTFNGTQQYEMILDTGASRTLITRQMANDLKVEVTDQMVAATASAAEVTFDIGQVRTIAMGSLTLSNAPVSIGDAVSVGLLGNDFFLGYDVIIRSREGVVELIET